jgi:ABC-type tungstate transport system substrate-binding protein
MKIANSIPMWLACALPVAFVILQAVLFARGAYKSGKKLGLNDKQMKKAMKSSAVTSIGPSIVVLSEMLSLLVSVGGPIGWMRLSMIGSVMFESIAAGLGTSAVGYSLERTH